MYRWCIAVFGLEPLSLRSARLFEGLSPRGGGPTAPIFFVGT